MSYKLPPKGSLPGAGKLYGGVGPTAMPFEHLTRFAELTRQRKVRLKCATVSTSKLKLEDLIFVPFQELEIELPNVMSEDTAQSDVAPPIKHIIGGKGEKPGKGKGGGGAKGGK